MPKLTVHALGNTITAENIKLTRNNGRPPKLILYKVVQRYNNHYRSLFGHIEQEYELGKTYTANLAQTRGFYLGSRSFVVEHYWGQFDPLDRTIAVIECLASISSCTFDKKRRYLDSSHLDSTHNVPTLLKKLEPHDSFGEVQVNKFKIINDVTKQVIDKYWRKGQQAMIYRSLSSRSSSFPYY